MPSIPAVTVIVRNYNRGERLLRACRSVLSQDFEDFELLLVDDASSDGSADAAQAAFGADPRFRLLRLPENRNAGGAAAVGVEASRAPLCAFLDSDDEWLPGALSAFVSAAEEEPDRQLFYGDVLFRYSDHGIEHLDISVERPDQLGGMLRGGFTLTMSSLAARRAALLAVGNYEARWTVAHDFHCHGKLALAYDRAFRRIRQPVARYNVSSDNVMLSYETWTREFQLILRELHEHPKAEIYRHELKRNLARGVIAQFGRAKNDLLVNEPKERALTAVVFVREGGAALEASMRSLNAQSAPPEEVLLVALGPRRPNLRSEAGGRWFSVERRMNRRKTLQSIARQTKNPLIAVLEEGDIWEPDYLAAQRRAHAMIAGAPDFSFADELGGEAEDIFEHSSDIASCWAARPFPRSYSSMVMARKALAELDDREPSPLGDDASILARLFIKHMRTRRRQPVRIRRGLLRQAAFAA